MVLQFRGYVRKTPLPPDLRQKEKEELRPIYHEKARRLGKISDEFQAAVKAAKEIKAKEQQEVMDWYQPEKDAIKEKYDKIAQEREQNGNTH